ncbi:MAG: hypothetical protein NTV80_07325, partial [Verrucomicrobia bacterium]|nr:hypothetical protein [Verrucomicrobiota bacterium]
MEAESTPVATKPKLGSGRSKGLLLLGVVWPSATILFEWLTRACAAEFFDPLPTWIHLFLVLLVPVTAFCAWRRSGHDDLTIAVPHERVLLGAAWFVASVYILSFVLITIQSMYLIMLVPLALAAEAGMAALLPWMAASLPFMALGPLMAWLTLWFTQKRLVKGSTSSRLPWVGAAAAALALCLVEVPLLFTSKVAQFHRGAQPSVKWTYEKGIRWIGSEPILRQLAYGRLNTPPGLFCWMGGGGLYSFRNFSDLASTESASDLYYRSYGRLHTQLQPLPIAQSHLDFDERRGGSEDGINGFVWDSDVGGDRTGVRMKGLTMKSSRLDWHLDPVSSLAYGEWTIEFNNSYSNPQEARCQILLPPSGFVSRLTLWVNGEPREAAFATPSKVKAAYQTVAIQQRRDPVLVNITGPDRIMAQCFPVPVGGMIKIRLGITAPIPEEGLVMPALIERNFTIPEGTRHHTWLQSP